MYHYMSTVPDPSLAFLKAERQSLYGYGDPSDLAHWERPDIWPVNDSPFSAYCDYAMLSDDKGGVPAIVDKQLGQSPDNVGLDLAGGENGIALRDLMNDGIIGKALLTTYKDRRDDITKANKALGHVAGDLASPNTWQQIIDWKNAHTPDGFSLVLHRPVVALQSFRPKTYMAAAHLILDMVRPQGVVFSQVPAALYGRHLKTMGESLLARPDVRTIVTAETDWDPPSAVIIKH